MHDVDDLVTDRLRLTRWTEEHDAFLLALSSEPAVVRFIGDGRPWTRAFALEVAERNRSHWAEHGFGWRPLAERATGEVVGFIGLNLTIDRPTEGVVAGEHEIGWWLATKAWGRGFAAEGARAVAAEAWDRLGAPSLLARIQAPNDASKRVARGIGLRHEETGRTPEGAVVELWRARR